MTIWDRLDAWFNQRKREDGLVDIKFYQRGRRDRPLRHTAEYLVKGSDNRVDITKEKL